MRVVLVNPPPDRRYVRSRDEPLHLEYLAAQLRGAHDVIILDALGLDWTAAQAAERALAARPDVLGISAGFAATLGASLQIAARVKAERPEALAVLGGNTATFLAGRLASEPNVDAVVRGEGDLSFARLVAAADAGRPLAEIRGVSSRVDGRVIHAPDVAPVDLDALPLPARDLVPHRERYIKAVLSSRGCSYGCAYCSASAFWSRRTRFRSVENVLGEVERLMEEESLEYFVFSDDCFTLSRKRLMEICAGLRGRGIRATWSCTGRIETISAAVLDVMAEAGCTDIFFGVESGSPGVLQSLGRRYRPEDVDRVYELCLARDIRPAFSFIVGLPGETRADVEQTFALIDRLEGVECGTHLLTPFPGTPIAEDPERFGLRILPHAPGELDINSHSFIENGHLTPREVEEAQHEGIGRGVRAFRRTRRPAVLRDGG